MLAAARAALAPTLAAGDLKSWRRYHEVHTALAASDSYAADQYKDNELPGVAAALAEARFMGTGCGGPLRQPEECPPGAARVKVGAWRRPARPSDSSDALADAPLYRRKILSPGRIPSLDTLRSRRGRAAG
ncbi:MAG: hypothetical protein U1D00_20095, partial [Mycobacterium sp.]|nr:hypothetical protein [Mycobacterium sp.]